MIVTLSIVLIIRACRTLFYGLHIWTQSYELYVESWHCAHCTCRRMRRFRMMDCLKMKYISCKTRCTGDICAKFLVGYWHSIMEVSLQRWWSGSLPQCRALSTSCSVHPCLCLSLKTLSVIGTLVSSFAIIHVSFLLCSAVEIGSVFWCNGPCSSVHIPCVHSFIYIFFIPNYVVFLWVLIESD